MVIENDQDTLTVRTFRQSTILWIAHAALVFCGTLSIHRAIAMETTAGNELAHALTIGLMWWCVCVVVGSLLGSWSFLVGSEISMILIAIPVPLEFHIELLKKGIPFVVTISSIAAVPEIIWRHSKNDPSDATASAMEERMLEAAEEESARIASVVEGKINIV